MSCLYVLTFHRKWFSSINMLHLTLANEKFQYWYYFGRTFSQVYIPLKARGLWSKKDFQTINYKFGCQYTYDQAWKFVHFYFSYESLFEHDPNNEDFEPFDLEGKPTSIIGLCEMCYLNNIDKEKIRT